MSRPCRRCIARACRCRAAPARDPRPNSSPRSDRRGGRRAKSDAPSRALPAARCDARRRAARRRTSTRNRRAATARRVPSHAPAASQDRRCGRPWWLSARRRISRPSAMAPCTEPPSESSTTVAPVRSRPLREQHEVARAVGGDGAGRRDQRLAGGAADLGRALQAQLEAHRQRAIGRARRRRQQKRCAAKASAIATPRERSILPPS